MVVFPPLIGNPDNGYINPYYWVDEFIPYYMEIMGVDRPWHIYIFFGHFLKGRGYRGTHVTPINGRPFRERKLGEFMGHPSCPGQI